MSADLTENARSSIEVDHSTVTGATVIDHEAVVITSERYARSEWGDRVEWCNWCNGWVRRTEDGR